MRTCIFAFAFACSLYAAISPNANWDVSPGNGSNTNGGFFVAGGTGTDYSQQNFAAFSGSDLNSSSANSSSGAAINTTSSHAFAATDKDNGIYISGGNCTAGWYWLKTYNGPNNIAVDRAISSSPSVTGCSYVEGGRLRDPGIAIANAAANNTIWLQAPSGGYTMNCSTPNAPGCILNISTAGLSLLGYQITHGDFAAQFTINATSAIGANTMLTSSQQVYFANITLNCNNLSGSSGSTGGNGVYFNVWYENCPTSQSTFTGTHVGPLQLGNYATGSSNSVGALKIGAVCIGCESLNNTGPGIYVANGQINNLLFSVSAHNTGPNSHGITNIGNDWVMLGTTVAYNGGDATHTIGLDSGAWYMIDSLAEGNAANVFGLSGGSGQQGVVAVNNSYPVSPGGGIYNGAQGPAANGGTNCEFPELNNIVCFYFPSVPQTTTAFMDPTSNYLLNGTSTGGMLMRAQGYPTGFMDGINTTYANIGAIWPSQRPSLKTFYLTEQFGVKWPVQNIEMRYDAGPPPMGSTRLMRSDGTEMPYQWISGGDCWDSAAVSGCILVQDGLPAGSPSAPVSVSYSLETGVAPAATVTNPVTVTGGRCVTGVAGWIIANGLNGICVPKTQSAPYYYSPVQGIELSDGSWTGGAVGSPNLIYTNTTGSLAGVAAVQNVGPYNNPTSMRTPASGLFTAETTTFLEAGPLKTVVQLSYSATKPAYYSGPYTTAGGTSGPNGTITFNNIYSTASMVMFLSGFSLPSGLAPNTVYYLENCTAPPVGSPATCNLSVTPNGPIINLGTYPSSAQFIQIYNIAGQPGHLTMTITMYANNPGYMIDYDTDLVIRWLAPMFMETGHVFPNVRRYRGSVAASALCGYETPLTITNVTNTTPPVVTVSGRLNATPGYQVIIAGVQGAAGVNGTYYACNPNQQTGTFTLYSSSSCSGASPAAGGAYTSGGVAKPQYESIADRGPRDAFYDIDYSRDYIVGTQCQSGVIAELGVIDPAAWNGSGFYDMAYNSTAGPSAPVIGLFRGRISRQINNVDPLARFWRVEGWYASNSHWITGAQAFGLDIYTQMDDASPIIHSQFGIYTGTAGQLNDADHFQPIGTLQNNLAGPNLSSLYSYNLCGPSSCYSDPVGGWQYQFFNSTDYANLTNWFGNSTNYNNMLSSAGTGTAAAALYTLWNGNNSSTATTTLNNLLASGGTPEGVGLPVSGVSSSGNIATITVGPHPWLVGQTVETSFPGGILTAVIGSSGGTGYQVGDVLTVFGGNNNATVSVTSVGTGGVVTGIAIAQPGSSYSSETNTTTSGGHGTGALVTVTSEGDWNCSNRYQCPITAVTPTTISYALAAAPAAAYSYGGFINQVGMAAAINTIANGDNHWSGMISGYNLFQNQFYDVFPVCTATLHSGLLNSSQQQTCKSLLAFAGSLVWDKDWNCLYNDTTITQLLGASCSGGSLGLGNQIQLYLAFRSLVSSTLSFHPYLASKVGIGNGYLFTNLTGMSNPYGAGPASLHYQTNYTPPNYQNFQAGVVGGTLSFGASGQFPTWNLHAQWLLSGLTPPEARFGNYRKCVSEGDGNTEAICTAYMGALAAGLHATDPTLSGWLQYAWLNSNPSGNYVLDTYDAFAVNPTLPAVTPSLVSSNFPGYWTAMRYGFGGVHESSLHFIHGNFYSPNGHRHTDAGQVSIYAHNAPLAIDWNANLYYPPMAAGYCHNRVVYDNDLTGLTSWRDQSDVINCAASPGPGAALPSGSNTNFSAFTFSTQSTGVFTYSGGNTWTRVVRMMNPDSAYPLIFVQDSFLTAAGGADTTGKTLTWNLMAECTMASFSTGSCTPVTTPVGNLTPIYRNSTGCSSTPPQYMSQNDTSGMAPYNLLNGLQHFNFTGMQWPAHATNGINWDLWEIPSSGSAQFLIGNWSHGCNNTSETLQFYNANSSNPDTPYITVTNQFESQDILRIHDTGTFQTLIAPYRKTEAPSRTVTQQACGIQIIQGLETTCFNNSAMIYTNGSEQVLTTYDASLQSAYGMTASGGAQELVRNGSTITWTIEDVVAGTRCITLPAGQWYPSMPVQNNLGQYCYYHGGGPQPAPVTITFNQTQTILHNVTLSYKAPAGATQVAVKLGSAVNYAALAACSPVCTVSLQTPAGTYTEQHTFLDANGNVITSSQPRTGNY